MSLELAGPAELADYRDGDEYMLLEQAQAAVRDYCGWHIAPSRAEVVTIRPNWRRAFLPSLYVTAVTSVTVDGTALTAGSYQWARNGQIDLPLFSRSIGEVVVSLTHGYATTPPPVAKAVLDMVTRAKGPGGRGGLSQLRVGQVDRTFTADDLSDANMTSLGPYRIPGFA